MKWNPFRKKSAESTTEAVVEAPKKERVHLGDGARKAARRKFRHALQNTLAAEFRKREYSPKASRFLARVKADGIIANTVPTDVDSHGRGLVRA